jgi:polysaccharide biosynthesis/export protein
MVLWLRGPGLLVTLACTLLVASGALNGCAMDRPYVWAKDVPAVSAAEVVPVVHARDTLAVQVRDQVALSGEFIVREDGEYAQPTLGNVAVDGRTPAQVAEMLQGLLTNVVVNPRVTVSILRKATARVNVIGEVKAPGPYELTRDRSVTAALAAAGWLTPFASDDRIFVVRAGGKDARIRFTAQSLTAPDPQSVPFRLRDGDVVVVE